MPVGTSLAQRPVALMGTRRPASTHLGHVDLVDPVEAAGGVGGENAGQARGEGGAHHDVEPPLAGLGVEVEQGLHIFDSV